MNAVLLNPGVYEGTYKLIGEEICFDFVNTVSWPGTEREHDWLDQPATFIAWALAAGLITKKNAKALGLKSKKEITGEMDRVFAIRKDLRQVLKPFAFNKRPSAESVKRLETLTRQAGNYRQLGTRDFKWVWEEPSSFQAVLAPVIWNAAYVVTEADHLRIRHCPSCNWIFYDTTRNRSRRWCDMDDCGSRDKALRYYHRQK